MPKGKIDGLDPSSRTYLAGIEEMSQPLSSLNDIENLNDETTYSADELRDKIIEILTALKG